jgi:hypothetical protein
MDNLKKNKLLITAEAAFFTAEFANSNIKKYLALHGADVQKLNTYLKNDEAHYVMKIANENAHFVMKITDENARFVMKITDENARFVMKIADETLAPLHTSPEKHSFQFCPHQFGSQCLFRCLPKTLANHLWRHDLGRCGRAR